MFVCCPDEMTNTMPQTLIEQKPVAVTYLYGFASRLRMCWCTGLLHFNENCDLNEDVASGASEQDEIHLADFSAICSLPGSINPPPHPLRAHGLENIPHPCLTTWLFRRTSHPHCLCTASCFSFQLPGFGVVTGRVRAPGHVRAGAGAGVRTGAAVPQLPGHHHLCGRGRAPRHLRVPVPVQVRALELHHDAQPVRLRSCAKEW